MCFFKIFFPWQETFADARDGDGEGGGGEPFRTDFSTQTVFETRTFTKVWKKSQSIFSNMFIYKENDTESHRNTQTINI